MRGAVARRGGLVVNKEGYRLQELQIYKYVSLKLILNKSMVLFADTSQRILNNE